MKTNLDLGRTRLEELLRSGTQPGELGRCLAESRTKLIAAGARGSEIPSQESLQPRYVARLSPKAKEVVRAWFRSHGAFDHEVDPLVIIQKTIDASRDKPKSNAYEFWRAYLSAYVHDPIPEMIRNYLDGNELAETSPAAPTPRDPDEPNTWVTEEDIAGCEAIARGEPCPSPARPLPTFLAGVIAMFQGDAEVTTARKADLESAPAPLARGLGRVLEVLVEARPRGTLILRRATEFIPGKLEDAQSHPVFGVIKRILPSGQYFVSVKGLLVGDLIVEVSSEQARQLFPSNGDVTGYPRQGVKMHEGELGIWAVEYKSSDKTSQYMVKEFRHKVYELIQIPFPSTDPDNVREWIKQRFDGSAELGRRIFHLSDKLVLRMPGDPTRPGQFDFDTLLEGYWKHEAVLLASGQLIVVKPFGAPEELLDCSPPATALKRLLRRCTDLAGLPTLSNVQIKAIAEFAASCSEPGTLGLTYPRALARLRALESEQQLVEQVATDVLALPRVQQFVEAGKVAILDAFRQQQGALSAEISSLERKRQGLLQDIEKQQKAIRDESERARKAARHQEVELEKKIRTSFQRASEEGAELLAQVSLLRTVLGGLSTPVPQPTQASVPPTDAKEGGGALSPFRVASSALAQVPPLATSLALKKAIRDRAEAGGLSRSLLASVVAAGRASPVVGLIGRGARRLVVAVGDVLSAGTTCEVSITGDMFGIGDLMRATALVRSPEGTCSQVLGDFLQDAQSIGHPTIVELRGINRVPPETFLPELLDLHIDGDALAGVSWSDRSGKVRHACIAAPVVFLLTFVVGKSTFPIDSPLASQLPILQVDTGWHDEDAATTASSAPRTWVGAEIWKMLDSRSGEAEENAPGALPPLAQELCMERAAYMLGLRQELAKAIGLVSLSAGRRPTEEISELVGFIEREAPELLDYAREATSGETARILENVIHSEMGATA